LVRIEFCITGEFNFFLEKVLDFILIALDKQCNRGGLVVGCIGCTCGVQVGMRLGCNVCTCTRRVLAVPGVNIQVVPAVS
jgi:hypothetical protein